MNNDNDTGGIWDGMKVISRVTRADLLGSGDLVDVSDTAREAGFKFPVAMSRAAYFDCVEWSEADDKRKLPHSTGQSIRGRLWDVVSMLRFAIRGAGDAQTIRYDLLRVPREGRGVKPRLVTLKSIIGPGDTPEPVITILLPNED